VHGDRRHIRHRIGGDIGVRRRGSRGARSRLERRRRRVQGAEIDIAVMGRREGESVLRFAPGASVTVQVPICVVLSTSISADRGRERAGIGIDAGDRNSQDFVRRSQRVEAGRDRNDNAAVFLDDGVMHAAIDADRRREKRPAATVAQKPVLAWLVLSL